MEGQFSHALNWTRKSISLDAISYHLSNHLANQIHHHLIKNGPLPLQEESEFQKKKPQKNKIPHFRSNFTIRKLSTKPQKPISPISPSAPEESRDGYADLPRGQQRSSHVGSRRALLQPAIRLLHPRPETRPRGFEFDPHQVQQLEQQGRDHGQRRLAKPEDRELRSRRRLGEGEPGRKGGDLRRRIRRSLQAYLLDPPQRDPQEVLRLLLIHHHRTGRRNPLHLHRPRCVLQRPGLVFQGALGPRELELLQGRGPSGEPRGGQPRGRRRRSGGEVHPGRHLRRTRILVPGFRELREGLSVPLRLCRSFRCADNCGNWWSS